MLSPFALFARLIAALMVWCAWVLTAPGRARKAVCGRCSTGDILTDSMAVARWPGDDERAGRGGYARRAGSGASACC